jgi:hypothetical protein
VNTLSIQTIGERPRDEDTALYPDYLIGCLLREGVGRIEADKAASRNGTVEFVLTKANHPSRVLANVGDGFFRSVLARFGARCGIDNLYYGHSIFSCEHEYEGKIRTHRFSLFVCNAREMGFWMKLYLYAIDAD